MNDRSEFEDLGLPPDLAELDAELSSLTYEERPSFGPELEAELAREWARMPRQAPVMPRRHLAAAAAVALLAVGLGVPQARASLVRLVNAIQGNVAEASSPAPMNPAALPLLQFDPEQVNQCVYYILPLQPHTYLPIAISYFLRLMHKPNQSQCL